jgi:ABC-type lipoprotein release transport system permease subunit
LEHYSRRGNRRQLFEVQPLDPFSFSAAIALLVLVTLIATIESAIRASRSNPVEVLRRD